MPTDWIRRAGDALYGLTWAGALIAGSPYLAGRAVLRPREMRERFAGWEEIPDEAIGGTWVHASSLGELRGALNLLRALSAEGERSALTVMTPAARAAAAEARRAGAALVRHVPLDFPPFVRRAARRLRPRALLICETEIWPALLGEARRRRIPTAFVSARLTARGAARLGRVRPYIGRLLREGIHVAAQSERDAGRWRRLGVPAARLSVTGNLKYEAPAGPASPAERTERRRGWRRVVVLGSVRSGDADAVADAVARLGGLSGSVLFVLAPRHPARAGAWIERIGRLFDSVSERTQKEDALVPAPGEELRGLLVVRTIGELREFYRIADIGFVGATFCPIGGHNLFEVAELGVPVVYGPHIEHVADVAEALETEGGGWRAGDPAGLAAAMRAWLEQPEERARAAAGALRAAERLAGAGGRTVCALRAWGFPLRGGA